MQTYGGKFQKKSEETKERLLREQSTTIKTVCTIISLILWVGSFSYVAYKDHVVESWNEQVLMKTRSVWKGLDRLEIDLMNSTLFLKGCRKDIVFQEIPDGFEVQTVEMRNQSMEVLQNVPPYNETALPAYIGSGIRPGDELVYCNREEEKTVKLQVIRNNPRWNFHYLIFTEPVSMKNDIPANLIKFAPVKYRWEKQVDGSEKLFRSISNGQEVELLSRIQSHKIQYNIKDEGASYLTIELTLMDQFPNGEPIEFRRTIPFESFQRLPRELEDKVP